MHYSTRLGHKNPINSINVARCVGIPAEFQYLYLGKSMAENNIAPAMVANYCVLYQLHYFAIVLLVVQGLAPFVPIPLVFSVDGKFMFHLKKQSN